MLKKQLKKGLRLPECVSRCIDYTRAHPECRFDELVDELSLHDPLAMYRALGRRVNSNSTNFLLEPPQDDSSETSYSSQPTMSGQSLPYNKKKRGNRARHRRDQEEFQAQYLDDLESSSQNSFWDQSQEDESL